MNRAFIIAVDCCLATSCSSKTEGEAKPALQTDIASSTQAMASGQSIECVFDAKVVRVAPGEAGPRGYVIDPNPRWVVELDVLSHDKQKTPFAPGRWNCYIADTQSVFGVPPENVSGVYRFSYTWNVDVPGKPEFEEFRAVRVDDTSMYVK